MIQFRLRDEKISLEEVVRLRFYYQVGPANALASLSRDLLCLRLRGKFANVLVLPLKMKAVAQGTLAGWWPVGTGKGRAKSSLSTCE